MTMSLPRRCLSRSPSTCGSLDVGYLLADLVDLASQDDDELREADVCDLGACGVDLAVHLLAEELEPPSDRLGLV